MAGFARVLDSVQSYTCPSRALRNANVYLKPSLSPRQVAGGPVAEDALKCQPKPLVQTDYAPAVLSVAQFGRLQALFPGGVCD